MDSQRRVFVSEPEFAKLPPMEQERVSQCPTLAIGEVFEVKGVRFKVTDILSRGRMKAKMLGPA